MSFHIKVPKDHAIKGIPYSSKISSWLNRVMSEVHSVWRPPIGTQNSGKVHVYSTNLESIQREIIFQCRRTECVLYRVSKHDCTAKHSVSMQVIEDMWPLPNQKSRTSAAKRTHIPDCFSPRARLCKSCRRVARAYANIFYTVRVAAKVLPTSKSRRDTHVATLSVSCVIVTPSYEKGGERGWE